MRFLVFFLACGLFFIADAQAQWPRQPGSGYVQVSYGSASTDRAFLANGERGTLGSTDRPEEFDETAIYVYGEFGVLPNLTLIGNAYTKRMEATTPDETFFNSGWADAFVYLRYSLPQLGPVVLSPQVGVKVPLGYDVEETPPLGSSETDLHFHLLGGASLHPFPGYVGASAGYQVRQGIPENEWILHAEAGAFLDPRILLRVRVDRTNSVTDTGTAISTLGLVPEQGYTTVGPGLSLIVHENVQAHFDLRWTVDGRTTAALTKFFAGIAYVW
ncbi:MAG: hypothetical protein RhofKO_36610 [Rhodothermales bacterium]